MSLRPDAAKFSRPAIWRSRNAAAARGCRVLLFVQTHAISYNLRGILQRVVIASFESLAQRAPIDTRDIAPPARRSLSSCHSRRVETNQPRMTFAMQPIDVSIACTARALHTYQFGVALGLHRAQRVRRFPALSISG